MQQDGPSQWAGGGINVSGEAPFEIRGFSLANAAALLGLAVTVASFFEYFSTGGAGGLSGIGFVYGIPIALIGLALKVRDVMTPSSLSRQGARVGGRSSIASAISLKCRFVD